MRVIRYIKKGPYAPDHGRSLIGVFLWWKIWSLAFLGMGGYAVGYAATQRWAVVPTGIYSIGFATGIIVATIAKFVEDAGEDQ